MTCVRVIRPLTRRLFPSYFSFSPLTIDRHTEHTMSGGSHFFQKLMPRFMYNKIREMIVFRPEDHTNLIQALPRFKQNVPQVPRIKGYRYPAPGSAGLTMDIAIPLRDHEDQVYDTKLYARDSRNLAYEDQMHINTKEPVLLEPNGQYGDRTYGQEGKFKNPAVTKYDPSGLRATMNTTWAEMDKSLAENAAPNHLPRSCWENEAESLEAEAERKGLPQLMGRYYGTTLQGTQNYTEIRW